MKKTIKQIAYIIEHSTIYDEDRALDIAVEIYEDLNKRGYIILLPKKEG